MAKIRWGVIGVAKIATRKVIPAMQCGAYSEVTAIASRDLGRAEEAAAELGIPRAYGSYEELLADGEIDAVYNPLPNHLHVPWSVRAAEAGKHVLCEKPIALNVGEVRELMAARDRAGVKIGEAFMVRTHPQWLRAREIVRSGELGEVRSIHAHFSYFNRDPLNVRNNPAWGGGGVMDIGCYPITMARFLLDQEPRRVSALVDLDPDFRTDRLASVLLDFQNVQVSFTCSMQMVPYQRLQVYGTKGRLEVIIPWNAPPDAPTRIIVDVGGDLSGSGQRTEEFAVCDQYTIQGDLFSRAILENTEVPAPLEESILNMAVIEAVLRSGRTGQWESCDTAS